MGSHCSCNNKAKKHISQKTQNRISKVNTSIKQNFYFISEH